MRMTFISLFVAAFMLGGFAMACGDDDSCEGRAPEGTTCQQADGTCVALTCTDDVWSCSSDATEVALIPANCSN